MPFRVIPVPSCSNEHGKVLYGVRFARENFGRIFSKPTRIFIMLGAYGTTMKAVDPHTPADHYCVDCGRGVSPHQANLSREQTQLSRALGDSRNREGFVLCRKHLDKETRE